jgi:hypothetical protein
MKNIEQKMRLIQVYAGAISNLEGKNQKIYIKLLIELADNLVRETKEGTE